MADRLNGSAPGQRDTQAGGKLGLGALCLSIVGVAAVVAAATWLLLFGAARDNGQSGAAGEIKVERAPAAGGSAAPAVESRAVIRPIGEGYVLKRVDMSSSDPSASIQAPDGTVATWRAGVQLPDGTRLERIGPSYVILGRGGETRRIGVEVTEVPAMALRKDGRALGTPTPGAPSE
ncbi:MULTISPECIES: hypothetical protein [unclassified Sphingomonas]|uniref:hypothetical protein n=1 Tax=unclassified Sphingomonas TaxID=196159 RepID=UPI000832477F|nr:MULTISPECIES: hypothetical protein [unclassified Sphingomonas]